MCVFVCLCVCVCVCLCVCVYVCMYAYAYVYIVYRWRCKYAFEEIDVSILDDVPEEERKEGPLSLVCRLTHSPPPLSADRLANSARGSLSLLLSHALSPVKTAETIDDMRVDHAGRAFIPPSSPKGTQHTHTHKQQERQLQLMSVRITWMNVCVFTCVRVRVRVRVGVCVCVCVCARVTVAARREIAVKRRYLS
jgi:hypothetical protein